MKIAEYQAAIRARPQVWAVYVTCEGETDIAALYDSKEAAEVHKEWQNNHRRYYGRASIGRLPILNMELAAGRFTPESKQPQ